MTRDSRDNNGSGHGHGEMQLPQYQQSTRIHIIILKNNHTVVSIDAE